LEKTLLICTENTAGMLPYASAIVNSMESKSVFSLLVSDNKFQYEKLIKPKTENHYFVNAPKTKIKKILFRLFPYTLYKLIINICKSNKIDNIHFLTQDTILIPFLLIFSRNFNVFYTVHDLKEHEIKFNSLIHFLLSYLLFFIPVKLYIKCSKNLVTNSKYQFDQLKKMFNYKNIFFHSFPSLINDSIISGEAKVLELKNEKNYILFFGRFEEYKGIKTLYDTYVNNTDLQSKKLVLAGSGNLDFEMRKEIVNDKVIIINRFIDDSELNDLFNKSSIIVYPYISATQSGVLSLALYFNKPLVVSDVPFFKEIITNDTTGTFFKAKSSESLYYSILKNYDNKYVEKIIRAQNKCYNEFYSINVLKSSIKKIYQK